ncbi:MULTISPECIES: PQQ-dependent sugar dehydrogenase [Bacillus]|nr:MULTISPECIES: PQQ-dependent sugar dehydrogenase [Bacillus]MBP1083654.1 glucose/arabinose dehydrogenase [Bacillus capparidis]MED1094846.1 PQQ-dependent sugar dehydrogenase [Bacillus capparidis]
MYKKLSLLLLLLLMTGCSQNEPDEEPRETTAPGVESPDNEVIAEHLDIPWNIAGFNGTFYLTERNGSISSVIDGQVEQMQLQLKEEVHAVGEGGLLGFVLHPDFGENREAFIYHSYLDNNEMKNRVVKVKLEDRTWTETETIMADIPGATFHNGGRLAIGPDEKLYITTGDAGVPDSAQAPGNVAGKILRVELNGDIPADNPFSGNPVYSYGHRNPQGLAWIGNDLYSSEHGQSAHDEINKIEPGKNYGWPLIEGDETQEGMQAPLVQSGETTWAPSGIEADANTIYMSALRGEGIYTIDPKTAEVSKWLDGYGRIRDVKIIDDHLYFITNNGDGRGTKGETDDRLVRVALP